MSIILFYSARMGKISKIFLEIFLKYPVSRIVLKIVKGWTLCDFFNVLLLQKIKGGSFGDIKKMQKIVSQSRNNMHKKILVKGKTRTHVLLLGRPQKLL